LPNQEVKHSQTRKCVHETLEKFMQKGSLWNYPVPRPKILYSPPFCMYGRGGYFPLKPLLVLSKLGYPSLLKVTHFVI